MPATSKTKPYNEAPKLLRGWCIVKLYKGQPLNCITLDMATDMGLLLYTDFGFVKNENFMQYKL